MALEFTATGVTVETFDEIYNRLADGLKAIYGADIDLSQNTPDGQRVGIIAKEILDGQTFGQLLYSQMDINFSFGSFLDVISKLAGVLRRPATLSQADITLVSDRTISLEAGYTIRDENGNSWKTDDVNSIVSGSNTITVFAEDFGEVSALANTIITPVTIVLGVQSVTNPLPAIVGVAEETDVELRRKRNKALELPAYSTLGAIISKVANLTGVTDVVGYENSTASYDPVLDMHPHSIWLIAEGGEVADIAEIFAKDKTGGTATKGAITGVYAEEIDRPNLPAFTLNRPYNFDRPTNKPLYVRVDATRRNPSEAIDLSFIETKIAERDYLIAEDADATSLYANAYQAGTNFVLYNMEISDDNITFVETKIDADPDSRFTLDSANVTVTEV